MSDEYVNKVIFRGRINIKAGQSVRYPAGDRLSLPWTGFFAHNLSANYVYVDWDAPAAPETGLPLYDYDWRNVDDFVIREYISFFCASAATVYVRGYAKTPLKYLEPSALIEQPQDIVSGVPGGVLPENNTEIPPLDLGPEYDYVDYEQGGGR